MFSGGIEKGCIGNKWVNDVGKLFHELFLNCSGGNCP